MTLEKDYPFLLKLDLQAHADGDDDNQDDMSGDDMLADAIRSLLNPTDDDDNDDSDDIDNDDDQDDDSDDDDDNDDDSDDIDDEDDSDDDDDDDTEPTGKQSKEKNAEFARKRREAQAKKLAEEELARMKESAPEFKLAQMLSEQFGKPVDEIMEDIKQEQMKQEAKATGRTLDDVKRERAQTDRVQTLEQEIAMLKYQGWENQMKVDGANIMKEYPMLTQEDIDSARNYILNTAKNVELPLQDAVFAVHGKKIVDAMAKGKVQDELANASGRKKKTPLSPNNGKGKKVVTLSAEEQAMARAFGMSDEEYNKYK